MAILQALNGNTDIMAQLEALRAENARLKAAQGQRKLTLKVSAKGALSIYGMGRFPVTLYASQWRRLLGSTQEIEAALADWAGQLSEQG